VAARREHLAEARRGEALLGLQVVIEDYVADKGMRAAVLIAVKFALAVAAVVGVLAVLRVAFGAAA